MKHMKLWLFIFFLFLIQTQFLLCQGKFHPEKISESTNEYVNKIAEINQIGCSVYGKCKQWENFQDLRDEASDEELLELTNHPKGVVRCYAFWAILKKNSHDLIPLIQNHLYDYEEVYQWAGDIGIPVKVGDFLIEILKSSSKKETNIDSLGLAHLDSILIYSDTQLCSKIELLENIVPTEQLYPRIRAMVIAHTNSAALIPLVKYRKVEDIPLIINYPKDSLTENPNYYIYKAIQLYPNEKFYPFLENAVKNDFRNGTCFRDYDVELYSTIAMLKNSKAVELLNYTFRKYDSSESRDAYKSMFYRVVDKYRCTLYYPFFWKLWEEDTLINNEIFIDLLKDDTLKASRIIKGNLINFNSIYHYFRMFNLSNADSVAFELLRNMINVMIKNDYAYTIDAIKWNIENGKWGVWRMFMKQVAMIKDTAFVESLFKRLENESKTDNCLTITKVLISYHDNAINQRIFKTMKNEKVFQNEKARDEIEDLLDENDIEEE